MSRTIVKLVKDTIATTGTRNPSKVRKHIIQAVGRKIPLKQVKEAIESIGAVQQISLDAAKFPQSTHVSHFVNDKWYIDLVELPSAGFYNKPGAKFLLTVIDHYSRFAWVRRLPNKQATTTSDAFEDIVSKAKKPRRIVADKGSEWATMRKNFFFIWGDPENKRDTAPIERFNRTILEKLRANFAIAGKPKSNTAFDTVLAKLVESYNTERHRGIKEIPQQVYQGKAIPKFKMIIRRWKLQSGDKVRLVLNKKALNKADPFAKGARDVKLSDHQLDFVAYEHNQYKLSDGKLYRTREIYPVRPVVDVEEQQPIAEQQKQQKQEKKKQQRLRKIETENIVRKSKRSAAQLSRAINEAIAGVNVNAT